MVVLVSIRWHHIPSLNSLTGGIKLKFKCTCQPMLIKKANINVRAEKQYKVSRCICSRIVALLTVRFKFFFSDAQAALSLLFYFFLLFDALCELFA